MEASREQPGHAHRTRTVAVMAGRYAFDGELTLGPADRGLAIVASPAGADVVLSGATEYDLTFTELAADAAARLGLPKGVMRADLPAGRPLPGPAMYRTAGAGGTLDPRYGDRLVSAREPDGR